MKLENIRTDYSSDDAMEAELHN